MSSLIEIELPRYTIAPLERHCEEYWKIKQGSHIWSDDRLALITRAESTLSLVEDARVRGFLTGGSWRAFHWRKLVVGRKLYRIQYEDELREPPAEIDFEELIHFLLDWGAVPDSMGWEKLRSGGLWTPAGTVLLRKPDENAIDVKRNIDWVLRTSVPDDSDGILSLSVRWSRTFDEDGPERSSASLPPGWGRLSQPSSDFEDSLENADGAKKSLYRTIEELKSTMEQGMKSDSFRFRMENNRISKIFWERDKIETGSVVEVYSLHEQKQASQWFTSAAAAVISNEDQDGALWGFEIPESISSFALKPSIPCGVLVIQELLADSDAPEWSSELGPIFNGYNVVFHPTTYHNRTINRIAAEKLEATMPPEQARIHKLNREANERREMMEDMQRANADRIEREEKRVKEAIGSPKMNHRPVAEACVKWLVKQKRVERDCTVEKVAAAVLYLLVVDQRQDGDATRVLQILQEWMDWSNAGGMKKAQVELLGRWKSEFCYAACLVVVIAEAAARPSNASTDMLECFKSWNKVRLG